MSIADYKQDTDFTKKEVSQTDTVALFVNDKHATHVE